MQLTHNSQIKQLNDMIDTVNTEETKKLEEIYNEHQSYREEVKNRNLEETNAMKMYLDSR